MGRVAEARAEGRPEASRFVEQVLKVRRGVQFLVVIDAEIAFGRFGQNASDRRR